MMPEPDSSQSDLDQLKRALAALKRARARIDALEQARAEPVAVIGMGCRLPGEANTPQAFWELLRSGQSAITDPPPDRWDALAVQSADPDMPGKVQSSACGFVKEIDQFDAHFFGITPREANAMDPQQRLVLESAWEALEDAGLVPGSLAGSNTGVFIGIGLNDYSRLQIPGQVLDPTLIDNYFIQGNALCITANRISYILDLRGPSMAIDTACSSSMVAVHNACQSLRSGESSLALVGGSNVILAPDNSIGLKKFLSSDGLCKAFDSRADGYTRGEGAIILVLKRLSEAVSSGDRIYAVIRGSAINQDGFSSGLTVPNGVAQEALLRLALTNAGLNPGDIDYVEAHGTGTALGDPIEANALGAVFAEGRSKGQELLLGSVKTNIGHLEAGAGIAGMLKVILALHHGEIPASLNYIQPNPLIDFETLGLKVVTQLIPWPQKDSPSRAGVSSFGFGGANAHAILEAYQPVSLPDRQSQASAESKNEGVHLLTLSAKTPQALSDHARRMAAYLSLQPRATLAEICHTANRRRSHFAHRLAIVDSDGQGMASMLKAYVQGEAAQGLIDGQAGRSQPKVAYLFTGQGSQYLGMGRQLYEYQPAFRAAMDRCDELLKPILGLSLLELLYPGLSGSGTTPPVESQPKIDHTQYTQPALFAFEYALSELWRSWGVEPAVVMGHSVGEYVAACVAGAMSLEDGIKLIAARGRLMGALPQGGEMAAVFAPLEIIQPLLEDTQVSVAAINGPDNVVISGEAEEMQGVLKLLQSKGVKARSLVVSHAFHSSLMDPILDEFEAVAMQCNFKEPRIMLISNITGKPFKPGETPNPAYWRQHVRSAVNFASGMDSLHSLNVEIFLEIGPNPTLLGMGKRCLEDGVGVWLPSLRQGHDEISQIYMSLGSLYCRGIDINWAAFENYNTHQPVSLPTYPFQHERYWFSQANPSAVTPFIQPTSAQTAQQLLGNRLKSPLIKDIVYETILAKASLGYLWDHRAFGTVLFPAAGFIAMALEAAKHHNPGRVVVLEDLTIQEALVLPETGHLLVQLIMSPKEEGYTGIEFYSSASDLADSAVPVWTMHASARVRQVGDQPKVETTLEQAQAACSVEIPPHNFYEQLRLTGMEYGPAFQGIQQLWRGDNQALARVVLPENLHVADAAVHPALLDACLQTLGLCLTDSSQVFLPLGINHIGLIANPDLELWSYAQINPASNLETFSGDIVLFTTGGDVIGQITGIQLKRASQTVLQKLAHRSSKTSVFSGWLYRMEWQQQSMQESKVTPGIATPCVIFSDAEAGEILVNKLAGSILAIPGERFSQMDSRHWLVDPARPEDFQLLIAQVNPQTVICHTGEVKTVLHLLQAVCDQPVPAATWLVTQGSQSVFSSEGSSEDISVTPASIWGMARSVRLEVPDFHLGCIDLDPAALTEQCVENILSEIQAQSDEDEVAYRNDNRFVNRMRHFVNTPSQELPVRLEITNRGLIDTLAWQPMERSSLAEGDVEIAVRATGLNFRDVLNTLGLYPGDAGGLGNECSGVVTRIGANVKDFKPGDAVLGLATDSFSTYVVTRQEFLMPKPPGMSFVQAATIPIAFLTADYALNTLGKLKPGERVLIHAAAGGVGLAAVQLALQSGAEIFATAGSPEKRALLLSLGVHYVFDSRTLSFAEEIQHVTGGDGVHMVLNSLSDEFIPKSLGVLVSGGRFLEIGKRGIWSHEQVAALGNGIDYHIIYLGEVCDRDPALIHGLFASLVAKFKVDALKPLPWRAFPQKQASEAFRFMAQARHVGKIIVTQPSGFQPLMDSTPQVRDDRSYLITGGLGGIGLKIAQWLLDAGARHVIVVSRHAPSQSERVILDEYGPSLIPIKADVSQMEEVQRLFARIQEDHPPLAGIIHAAGVLEDGLLQQQNWKRYESVFAPKLDAAWHLHNLSLNMPLDFFILFSAGAGWLGSAGQSGYAGANTGVDALVQYRQARGLPALSLAWGPWEEVGMASRLAAGDKLRMAHQGLESISPQDGVEIFSRLVGYGGSIGVLPMNWTLYTAGKEILPPRFFDLAREAESTLSSKTNAVKVKSDILKDLSAAPQSKRKTLLQAHIREQTVRVLGLNSSYMLDTRQPLREIGMDSLMAVELRNALASSLQRKLPSTLLFDFPTIEALTDFLMLELWPKDEQFGTDTAAILQPKVSSTSTSNLVDIDKLTDEEAEAQLLAELDELKKK